MRKKVVGILGIVWILVFFPGFTTYGFGPRVTVYQHCGYQGYYVSLSVGSYTLSTLTRLGMRNDDISSVRIPPGLRVFLYEHDNFGGRSWFFESDIRCFTPFHGLNDTVSSIVVQYK